MFCVMTVCNTRYYLSVLKYSEGVNTNVYDVAVTQNQ